MDTKGIESIRFLGITLLLNGVLAGSRLLVVDSSILAIGLTAVFVALIFGLATYLVHGHVSIGALIPAIGGGILLLWLNSLSLWGAWLWGLVLASVLVPALLLVAVRFAESDSIKVGILAPFAVLAGIWWFRWTAVSDAQWWHWLFLFVGLFGLLWGWIWQIRPDQTIGLYLAVAFISLLQIGIVALLLPFSAVVNGALVALLFGLVCASCLWPVFRSR